MDIAVIGGGNGAYATAADLAEQGHGIRLWRRDAATFGDLVETRRLRLTDHRGTREVELALVGSDLGRTLAGAELIVVPLPATAQESVADALAPHLTDGQVVYLPPGSFGSYVMAARVRERGSRARVAFAEAGTLPYLARKHGPDEVVVSARATRLPSGVFPAALGEHAFPIVDRAYPAVERLADGLDGALMNAGPVIHPPLILMNAGPLEHFDRWDIHNEGTQPAVRAVADALDAERIALRERLGYPAPHFPLADHYSEDGGEWMYGDAARERLVDSGDWRESIDLRRHRYMREDVAVGLAFLVSVAEWAGLPCPVARGLLALGSAVVGEDFRQSGRTIERLDLDHLAPEQLKVLLARGFAD